MVSTATPPDEPARLPAHLEVAGLLRCAQAEGGFAAVIKKGERDGGTILVILAENGANPRVYERMPDHSGHRIWTMIRAQDTENKNDFQQYLDRRAARDHDLWIIELDSPGGERFIGLSGKPG